MNQKNFFWRRRISMAANSNLLWLIHSQGFLQLSSDLLQMKERQKLGLEVFTIKNIFWRRRTLMAATPN